MSFNLVEQVLAHVDAAPARKLVMVVLARHANADGVAWPSIDTISRYANVGERYVRTCLRELEDEGLLEIRQGGHIKGTTRRSNVYQLKFPECGCPRNGRGYIDHRPPAQRQIDPDDEGGYDADA